MNKINGKDLREQIQNNEDIVIVDVREDYEYDLGHIKECNHIPLDNVLDQSSELLSFKKIVFYCQTGIKSAAIAHTFERKFEHDEVCTLNGGYEGYLKSS